MNNDYKFIIKLIISQFFMITVCVMLVTAILDLITGNVALGGSEKAYPWIAMLTGLAGALPSVLFFFREEPTKFQFYRRVAVHIVLIEALKLIEGAVLNWYSNFSGALLIFAAILAVYLLVWFFTMLLNRNAADGINKALQEFNADEE